MRRRAFVIVAVLAALAAALVATSISTAAPSGVLKAADLFAGKTTDVGDVYVWNDATNLYVEIDLTGGWCMTESHVAVASVLAGIPQVNGNPPPGQFPYGNTYSPCATTDTFIIPLAGLGSTPVIAVHTKVWDPASETTLTRVSRAGVAIVGGGSSVAAIEPGVGVSYPACPAGDNDAVASLWDSNAKFLNGTSPSWGGADWIWKTAYPANPVSGEVVTFSEGFTLSGPGIGGNLIITADNAYSATLNGSSFASISKGPAFPGVLKENVGSGPQVGSWGVASQGWQLVNSYTLGGLSMGPNALTIQAANEYMFTDDTYKTWNAGPPQGYSGSTATDSDGAVQCTNPAGLIYKLSVDYLTKSETAWAGTSPGQLAFLGKNWATYFTYTLQDVLLETVTVPAALPDGPAGATSTTVLADGKSYRFEVTGTVIWTNRNGSNEVDAECTAETPGVWTANAAGYPDGLLELQVDLADKDWAPLSGPNGAGCSVPDHEYTLPFTGTGATVNFRIYDGRENLQDLGWFLDNSGSLTVQIWRDF